MWSLKEKEGTFRNEVGLVPLIFEDCPKCGKEELRYPVSFKGARCPDCSQSMPGYMLSHEEYNRKHYHLGLEYSAIGKILLCDKSK